MLFKILKEYLRRITRNYKIYLISILGMSIAIIASFHIYHFVYKELSVDTFHTKRKDIYRLVDQRANSNTRYKTTPFPLGKILKEKIPEIKDYARINTVQNKKLNVNEHTFKAPVSYIDIGFFKIFNFKLKEGSIQKFDDTPNGVIISEKIANTLFKNTNPIGNIITLSHDYNANENPLEIVGIIKNIPQTSTIQGDYFVNIKTIEKKHSKTDQWIVVTGSTLYIYAPILPDIKKIENIATKLLFDKMKPLFKTMFNQDIEPIYNIKLQAFDTIYFNSNDILGQKYKGDLQFLKIVMLVGFLSLFLATSNYIIMNLGLNLNRVKEFMSKRYLGASKFIIASQFIIESLLNSIICFCITLLTYPIIGAYIGELIGLNYQLSFVNDILLLLSYLGIIMTIGIVTGTLEFLLSYNAIFLKRNANSKKNSWFSKKVMITFQLFLFLSLTICILFVSKQIDFIQNKDLGFDAENTANIPTRSHKELKKLLEAKSYVKATSYSSHLFTSTIQKSPITSVGTNKEIEVLTLRGDYNFLKVYDIELLYGENFPYYEITGKEKWINRSDKKSILTEVLVNEEFVRKANLKNPVGQIFNTLGKDKYVIKGVFKNVYNTPLYYPLQPLVITNTDYSGWYYGGLSLSFTKGSKNRLQKDLTEYFSDKGADPLFLDDIIWNYSYQDIYKNELLLKRLLQAFTLIVLFISILGIIAISLFITESKTKEIGVRKVNGATIKEILFMLNKDFIKWVGFAFIIACPLSYFVMNKWLENFAYKTELSLWVFVFSGFFTLIITLSTISWQSYKAATKNPVEALRDE